MSCKCLLLSLIFLLIMVPAVIAGDLYLLELESPADVRIAEDIIGQAHGMIDNRFIVELTGKQVAGLKRNSLKPELIAEDIDLSEFYIVCRIHSTVSKTAMALNSYYASSTEQIIRADRSVLDIISREGYMSIPIKNLETPFYYYSPTYSVAALEDIPTDTLADLIEQDSLYSYDTRLEAFRTRYIYTDSILAARDWLVAKYQSFGYTNVTTQLFTYNGLPCYNVICYKQGTTEANTLVVVGGHYDSINFDNDGNGMTYAPGADDNASGTSAVLEMARVMSQMETKKSYYFCAFSAEEVGLVGAYALASELAGSTFDVECMLNFDMVAYTEDEYDNLDISSGALRAYANAMSDAAARVSTIIPEYVSSAGSSDHRAFDSYGFPVGFAIEGDFNYPGWHTNLDLSSRLDFDYFEQVTRMGIAVLGHIENATHVTPIEHLYDIGDGQSIRIVWGDCDPSYDYSLLVGTSSGVYDDTITIGTSASCEYDVTGLNEGQTYYFSVMGENAEGYGPLYTIEEEGESYINPRKPSNVSAVPGYQIIDINWASNEELDFDHYQVLRRPLGEDWQLIADNLIDTTFTDETPSPHVKNEYRILAIDLDMNLSDSSNIVGATAATFDLPLLFVDETSSGGINPSDAEQEEFYQNTLFQNLNITTFHGELQSNLVTRSLSGQFENLIWLDDDLTMQVFDYSADTVDWYLDFNTNFCLAGWQTISWIAGQNPLPVGNFVRERFNISQLTDNTAFDFIGAYGQNGWPDITTRTDNVFSGLLPNVAKFAVLPGAEVIYTYNSNTDDPNFEGEPCGVLYDDGQGKSIVLAFPIIQLETSSAVALMSKIIETFGIEVVLIDGDVNNDGGLNLLDITSLISYLYKGGAAPPRLNLADVDANCTLNILDVTYLIAYLYKGGPEPLEGCVE